MKRIFLNKRKLSWIVSKTISVLYLLGLSFTGCLETTREIPITLTTSTSALHFPFGGDEQTITIDSNTNSWKLSCDASWVTITPSSGAKKGTVTVRAHVNEAMENLSATITITGTGILPPQTIPVTIGAAPLLTVTPPNLDFSATDTPKELTITSNTSWTVSNSASWLSIAPMSGANNGTLIVTAASNESTEQRTATVSVSNPELTQPRTVSVTQSGINPTLQVSPNELSFESTDSPKTFTVSSNISWSISYSDASWLTVEPMSGNGDGTVTVTAAVNTNSVTRDVTLTVNGEGVSSQTVSVTQSGINPTFQVSPNELSFEAKDSPKTFNINSNTSWSISYSGALWLTVEPQSGNGDGTVTVTPSSNTNTDTRDVTLTISGEGVSSQTVSVTQSGVNPILQVSPNELSFESTDSPKTFTVSSNISWSISYSGASWLTVDPMSGNGDGTVTVTPSANTNTASRNVNLTVSGEGVTSQTVGVSQSGIVPSINIDMVQVSGGTFTMGCTSEQGSDCYSNESPSHSVTLNTFYIGKYEVTQGQWKAVMDANPSYFPKGDNYPVENVSWNDIVGTSGASTVINGITYYANGFIYKLNQMTGKQYRLPTEAEWEYAARGRRSSGFKYSGSNTVGDVAWYYSNSGNTTHPVGTKAANELGIYDMSGNVWEWCSDWYSAYSSSPQNNPTGPSTGSNRVGRGGSWGIDATGARVSSRGGWSTGVRARDLGFRLASSSN